MAIQHRRGIYDRFDPSKLVAGEWAVVLSGDPNADDGRGAYVCFAAGIVKRVATFEDMTENIANIEQDLIATLTQNVGAAVAKAEKAAEDCEGITEAEQGRVSAESGRVTAEQGRVTAEQERVSAEQGRVTAENRRAAAEQSRTSAETQRTSAEGVREQAEEQRAAGESAREGAETSRASAESARVSAESGRQSAEEGRVSAESQRVSAEAARATAEAQRVADFAVMEQRSRGWLFAYCEEGEYDEQTRKPTVENPDAGTLYFTPVQNPTDTNRWLEWSWDTANGRWELQGMAELDVSATPLTPAQIDGLFDGNPPAGSEVLTGAGLSYLFARMRNATIGELWGEDSQ